MLDAVTGFAVVGVAIVVGYVIGRINLLGETGGAVLGRLVYFVLSPVLLFVVLADADVHTLFSALLPVSAITATVIILGYAAIARFVWRRSTADTLIGALAAGQVNSNNIGIPLSLYILGSAAYPAPVILFQLLFLTPISMAIFEATTAGGASARRIAVRTITNPIVVGSLLGVLASVSDIELPAVVSEPLGFLAAACVPLLLIRYGMSLHGQRVLGAAESRPDIILGTALKLVAMPLLAWVLAEFVFGLGAHDVLIVVVLASLPSAQNVYNYAQRFGVGQIIARDTILLTTILCIPLLLIVTVLLG
ncbi:AEC family transporter [Microbacterium sediminicola]|uniref:AEC family transporter n=1 Tax=Microbacterium sediminicola TaxID=415210 RepID=A0ABP4TVH5_9MICO